MEDTPSFLSQQKEESEKSENKLFKGKKDEKQTSMHEGVAEHVTSVSRRLNLLESRHNELSRRIHLNERNLIEQRKRLSKETSAMDSEIVEMKRDLTELSEKVDRIIAELKNYADIDDFNTLKKYIDLINPMDIVPREDIIKMIRDELKRDEQ